MTLFDGSGRSPLSVGHVDYAELASLENDMLAAVNGQLAFEEKLRGFFRSAIDEVIDTSRTGRFFFRELEKTEKTYLGTKFEILLRDWLDVPRGIKLDLLIGGREVDVKSTTSKGGYRWMIPPEALDEFCVLLRVNEEQAQCSVGLVKARPEYLRLSENRDKKTSFSAGGRQHIWWMVHDFAYTPNFWSVVSEQDRQEIVGASSGIQRVALLFERYQEVAVSRVQIIAVAAQDDPMRRIRRNGGARDILAPKGIAILYSENDRELMNRLSLTFGSREFMSYAPRSAEESEMLRAAGHID